MRISQSLIADFGAEREDRRAEEAKRAYGKNGKDLQHSSSSARAAADAICTPLIAQEEDWGREGGMVWWCWRLGHRHTTTAPHTHMRR